MVISPAVISAAKAAVPALGSVASSLIGAGGSIAGAGLSFDQQKALQANQAKINYEYAEKEARNKPTWNRAGLETAGYNPMLAVQNATSGANASWTSAQSANAPDISGGITQGIANAQSFQRLKNETAQAESVTDANYATADKAKAEKAEISARLPFVSKRQRAEIAQLEGDVQLMEAKRHYMEEQVALGQAGLTLQQDANAISHEKNEIERKGNPFRTVRDFGDKYNWSPRQFGQELGRRFAKDHFGRFYKGQ